MAHALAGAAGIVPTVLVVDGPCLGGVALALGLADIVVMTERGPAPSSTPPPPRPASPAPTSSAADLVGGAWVHHARSGVADLIAPDRRRGADLVGDLLDLLPSNNHEAPPRDRPRRPADRPTRRAAAAVPHDGRASYDVRTVIEDIVDDGARPRAARPLRGQRSPPWLARVAGMPVGILANQPSQLAGALDIEGSQKGGRFVRFCDAFGLPIVTLVDTPGFRPGRDQEWRGMIRHGAKLAFAYAEATVPRVCVVLRKAYGGAYIVMDCKSMGDDCAVAWPTAEVAVMGARGAVEILHRRELVAIDDEERQAKRRRELEAEYEAVHLSPAVAAERGFIDEVIDPADTRTVVGRRPGRPGRPSASACPTRRHENIPL